MSFVDVKAQARAASVMVSVVFTQTSWLVCSLLWWFEKITERKEMTAKGEKNNFLIGKQDYLNRATTMV